MALIKCPDCGTEVSSSAKSCPKCARPLGRGFVAKALVLFGLLFVAFVVLSNFSNFLRREREKEAAAAVAALQPRSPDQGAQAVETQPEPWVQPKRLVEDYEKNEVGGDAKYKSKPLRLVGRVDGFRKSTLGSIIVYFDSGRRGALHAQVQCDFEKEHEALVGSLSEGQLLAVRGEVIGRFLDTVHLKPCVPLWAGAPPQQKKTKADDEDRMVAWSAEACFGALFTEFFGSNPLATGTKPDGGAIDEKALAGMASAVEKAEKALRSVGRALPCDHPLVHLVFGCEMRLPDFGPECRSGQVDYARRSLQQAPRKPAARASSESQDDGEAE